MNHKLIGIAIGAILVTGVGLYNIGLPGAAAKHLGTSDTSSQKIVAEVNNVPLYEADISPFLAQGLDRPNAIDRAINKTLASDLGFRQYKSQADAAFEATRREVGAQVFLNEKSAQISKSLTDKELKERYDVLIKNSDFNSYKLRAGVFPDQTSALEAIASAKGGKDSKDFQSVGNGWVSSNEVPYGLSPYVKALKTGEYSAPTLVRNGYLVLHVVEVKKNPVPVFADVKGQITSLITQERVNDELARARGSANIVLKH